MQDVDRKADNQERPYRDVVERRRWMATLAKTDRLLQGRTATVDIKPLAFRLDGRWTASSGRTSDFRRRSLEPQRGSANRDQL